MDASTWGFVGAIAGTLVGSLASILTTIISGRNSRKEREFSDSLERAERAREFQRSNLLELQEILATHLRLVARAHFEDFQSYRANPAPNHIPLLSKELNQELMQSSRRLSVLIERVADDALRSKVKEMRSTADSVLTARSPEESKQRFLAVQEPFPKVMEDLGLILRKYY